MALSLDFPSGDSDLITTPMLVVILEPLVGLILIFVPIFVVRTINPQPGSPGAWAMIISADLKTARIVRMP